MNPFVVIESLDAAGGSTQTKALVQKLRKNGYKPHQYHFPQEDRPTGQLIYRKFLQNKERQVFSRREQALLYIQDFYARLEDMQSVVENGPSQGVLLSDRYCTSTMAYQTIGLTGSARDTMLKWLTWLCWREAPQLLKPSLVILLDNPVDVSLQRLKKSQAEHFDNRQQLQAIRRSYLRLAKEQRWKVIDNIDIATSQPRSKQDIHQEIWQYVQQIL